MLVKCVVDKKTVEMLICSVGEMNKKTTKIEIKDSVTCFRITPLGNWRHSLFISNTNGDYS